MGQLLGTQVQPRRIAQLAYAAGWTDATQLATAVAVCLAESQGFDRAINKNPDGSSDRGMWQLNTIHDWISDATAYDPVKATAAAHKLWGSSGWNAWAAHKSGVFLHDAYTGRASLAVANFLSEWLGAEAKIRGTVTGFRVPLISHANLAALYPHVVLG